MNKSRFGQKSEEKQNIMRERSTVYKEKEKVQHVTAILIWKNSQLFHCLSHAGYNGYVPTARKAEVWIVFLCVHRTVMLWPTH